VCVADEVNPSKYWRRQKQMLASAPAWLTLLVTVAGCTSSAPPAPKMSERPPNTVSISRVDANRTITVSVPARINLTLPYAPASGMIWQLASGGAGFSSTHAPVFHPPSSDRRSGTQVFTFAMQDPGKLPLVVDYTKPGPITGKPKQFTMALQGR